MPRRYDNSDRGVLITEDAARRLSKVINQTSDNNRDVHAPKLRTAFDEGEGIQIGRTTAAWAKDTTQEIDVIYETECDEEGEPTPLEAWNLSFPVAANVRVKVARATNGCWYLIQAESCESVNCCPNIGGQDLTVVTNYSAGSTQILGHENGCLKWFDVYACPEEE